MTQLTKNTVADWVQKSKRGDCAQYHCGFLARDIDKSTSKISKQNRDDLKDLAAYVYRFYELGKVELVQQRVDKMLYLYFVIKKG